MEIDGTRALIAGATGGFGGALAREVHRRGGRLVVSGRDPARLGALSRELGAAALPADLTEAGAADRLVAGARDALGGLDLVVCAIGVVAFGAASELGDDTLERLFAVNTLAPMRLTRAALRVLPAGGAVVNVSAVVADQPTAGMAAYSASKAALTAFDAAVRREARRTGVRVLDLRPPHMETGLAGRPIAGAAPALREGRDPAEMAARAVDAVAGEAADAAW